MLKETEFGEEGPELKGKALSFHVPSPNGRELWVITREKRVVN